MESIWIDKESIVSDNLLLSMANLTFEGILTPSYTIAGSGFGFGQGGPILMTLFCANDVRLNKTKKSINPCLSVMFCVIQCLDPMARLLLAVLFTLFSCFMVVCSIGLLFGNPIGNE